MDQIEFFDAIKDKKMKEALITFECGCQTIYSPVTKEVFVNLCLSHKDAIED